MCFGAAGGGSSGGHTGSGDDIGAELCVLLQSDSAIEAVDGLTRSLPGAVVCISVGVTKASGLQVQQP